MARAEASRHHGDPRDLGNELRTRRGLRTEWGLLTAEISEHPSEATGETLEVEAYLAEDPDLDGVYLSDLANGEFEYGPGLDTRAHLSEMGLQWVDNDHTGQLPFIGFDEERGRLDYQELGLLLSDRLDVVNIEDAPRKVRHPEYCGD